MARGSALLASLAASLLFTAVAAQQNPPPVPQFRTRVDLVVLDVSVLDRDRRPVRGLTAADFTVLEDGRPQSIQMFTAVDIPDPDAAPAAGTATASWLREVASDVRSNEDDANAQILMLLLDDANPMAAGDLLRAKQYARSIIERLGPRDLGAVAFVADARSGQEFTHDKRRLVAAVDRFSGPMPGTYTADGLLSGALEWIGPTMTLRSLKGQAESLAELPAARKTVIFISTRGAALPDVVTGLGDAEGLDAPVGADTTGMQMENLGEFGQFVRAAQRANLNVYCLDPGGLRAPSVVSTPFSATSTTRYVHNPNVTGIGSLLAISNNTGGFAIVDTNDPQPGITQVFRENRSYYLLAYASSNSRVEGRYRKTDIRVDRPGVTVRARNGYFEPDRKEMKKATATPSSPNTTLAAPLGRADIPLQVTAAPFAIPGRKQAAVAVALAIRQSATEATARVANLDVTVNAYDYLARRRASDRFQTHTVLKPTPSGEAVFEVLTRLDLAPGRYQLRAAVAQTTEPNTGSLQQSRGPVRSGSVFYDLDVPDFASERLSLSGVILASTTGVRVAGGARLKPVIPVVPTTLRQFTATDNAQAFVRVYQGGNEPVAAATVSSRIVDERNATVFEAIESVAANRFSSARSADYSLPLPLARLKPGPYLLTMEVRQGTLARRRDVRFTLQ